MEYSKNMKCLIISNCHGIHYEEVLKKLKNHIKDVKIETFNFYHYLLDQLDIFEIYKEKIKECDLLVVQYLKDHKNFNIERIREVAKKDCIIIRIPRLLCPLYWPYESYISSKFGEHVRIPTPIKSVHDVPNFLNFCGKSDDEIKEFFDLKYNSLKEIQKNVDLNFLKFFDENYKKVALFKDSDHPTEYLTIGIKNMLIDVLIEKLSFLNLEINKYKLDPYIKSAGHYQVITNDVARVLGLDFDLDSYYVVSRYDYLTKIINYEKSENIRIGNDFNKIKNLIEN
jgi:hypothetical protein